MSRSRDRCIDLISKLHEEINKNDLSCEDYEKLILEFKALVGRLYLHRNKDYKVNNQ